MQLSLSGNNLNISLEGIIVVAACQAKTKLD